MHTDQDIAVRINFQQITVQRIEPQSAHRKRWIVLELQNFLRVSHVDQTLFDEVKAECLILRRFVLCAKD